MQHSLYVLLLTKVCLFLISSTHSLSYENCETPNNQEGECRSLASCSSLKELILKKPLTNLAKSYLRQSHCDTIGRKPWVCCPLSDINNTRTTRNAEMHKEFYTAEQQFKLPDPKDGVCGKSPRILPNRIVGGENTFLGEFPWMAALIYEYRGRHKSEFGCGGVIITKRHVLTAGHCAAPQLIPRSYLLNKVRLGEWDRITDPDCEVHYGENVCADQSYDLKISKTIFHENYDSSSSGQAHDIALIKLEKTIRFSDYVLPICVLGNSFDGDSGSATVIGFGKTEHSKQSDRLLKTELDFMSQRECFAKYRAQKKIITDFQVCARRSGSDSCNGDSGSPLMVQEVSGNTVYWRVIGIVSYGPAKCGHSDLPGIYTRVDKYISWIQNKIKL